MNEHTCLKENEWGQVVTTMGYIKQSLDRFEKRVGEHISDGEKPGGFRDRVSTLENEVKELKRRFWLSSLLGGVIGALIGAGATDAIIALANRFLGIK